MNTFLSWKKDKEKQIQMNFIAQSMKKLQKSCEVGRIQEMNYSKLNQILLNIMLLSNNIQPNLNNIWPI
ncbi:hypothetical protein FGO68_gene2293 [Halteria grandinella]|uniref:Uncharacterized protein n=1 Tax=Halteria grandinella TaxID=5974 RepID=A0A8J8NH91_HALGN|nr:hypothetical protein FGO68_gene2293 [Halteria grandinella]